MAGILEKYEQYLSLTIEPDEASTTVATAPQPPAPLPSGLSRSEDQRLQAGSVLLPAEMWRAGLTMDEASRLHEAYKQQNYIARWSKQRNGGYYVAAPGSGLR